MACAVVVGADGAILSQTGEFDNPALNELLSAIVGPYGNAKTTIDSLAGQLLPRIWAQGDAYAFLHKPSNDLMFVIVGLGRLDSLSQYQKSKAVDESIKLAMRD